MAGIITATSTNAGEIDVTVDLEVISDADVKLFNNSGVQVALITLVDGGSHTFTGLTEGAYYTVKLYDGDTVLDSASIQVAEKEAAFGTPSVDAAGGTATVAVTDNYGINSTDYFDITTDPSSGNATINSYTDGTLSLTGLNVSGTYTVTVYDAVGGDPLATVDIVVDDILALSNMDVDLDNKKITLDIADNFGVTAADITSGNVTVTKDGTEINLSDATIGSVDNDTLSITDAEIDYAAIYEVTITVDGNIGTVSESISKEIAEAFSITNVIAAVDGNSIDITLDANFVVTAVDDVSIVLGGIPMVINDADISVSDSIVTVTKTGAFGEHKAIDVTVTIGELSADYSGEINTP